MGAHNSRNSLGSTDEKKELLSQADEDMSDPLVWNGSAWTELCQGRPASVQNTPHPHPHPHADPASSLILCLLPTEKKKQQNEEGNKKRKKARTLYKMYKNEGLLF